MIYYFSWKGADINLSDYLYEKNSFKIDCAGINDNVIFDVYDFIFCRDQRI